MKQVFLLSLVLLMNAVGTAVPSGSDPITVRLRDGRELIATVDPRTDETRLWLHYGSPSVTVIRPIKWDAVLQASYLGDQLSLIQFRTLAIQMAKSPIVSDSSRTEPQADALLRGKSMAYLAQQALGFKRAVSTVRFTAAATDWDDDVEADGLLIEISAVDHQGLAGVACGTLNVVLATGSGENLEGSGLRPELQPHGILRWTRQVDEADYHAGIASVKLPFQAASSDSDGRTITAGLGIVEVQLAIAGATTFVEKISGVQLAATSRAVAPARADRPEQPRCPTQ